MSLLYSLNGLKFIFILPTFQFYNKAIESLCCRFVTKVKTIKQVIFNFCTGSNIEILTRA